MCKWAIVWLVCVFAFAATTSQARENAVRKVRVRRDIQSLAPDGPEIAALRRAVKVMKSRPATDPTSWAFQAAIHSAREGSHPAWNQCQHGNYYFLPWHRMYDYWFERILREASGDPDFTVPYWNYANPAARAVPRAFRVPADASNPLFVAERNKDAGGVNNGAQLPAAAAATFWRCFRLTQFATHSPTDAAFGGLIVTKPVHLATTMGAFESHHNLMHVLIGGENGLLSDPHASGLDPLFLVHHNNVDRLWKRWLDQGGGRTNPTDDNNWMDRQFTFFDEKGMEVKMAVREAIDTAEQLGYRYDDDPAPYELPKPAPVPASRPLRPIASSKGPLVDLGTATPTRVTISLAETARITDGPLTLLVEGIRFTAEPMLFYEVYVNLPPGQAPDFQSVHYAGNLVFAGVDPCAHARHPKLREKGKLREAEQAFVDGLRPFDITDVVHELRARKLWNERELTVTFVMNALVPVNGAAAVPPGVKARFERVTLASTDAR